MAIKEGTGNTQSVKRPRRSAGPESQKQSGIDKNKKIGKRQEARDQRRRGRGKGRDRGRGKRQEARGKRQEAEAEAVAEANAKGRGRDKGSRDFLNTF